jgi:hypothetical protein
MARKGVLELMFEYRALGHYFGYFSYLFRVPGVFQDLACIICHSLFVPPFVVISDISRFRVSSWIF